MHTIKCMDRWKITDPMIIINIYMKNGSYQKQCGWIQIWDHGSRKYQLVTPAGVYQRYLENFLYTEVYIHMYRVFYVCIHIYSFDRAENNSLQRIIQNIPVFWIIYFWYFPTKDSYISSLWLTQWMHVVTVPTVNYTGQIYCKAVKWPYRLSPVYDT